MSQLSNGHRLIESGGCRQSLHNEILVDAKPFNPQYPTFLLTFVHGILILIFTHSYHTLCRDYSTTSSFDIKTHLQPWRTRQKSRQATQFLPSHLSLVLPHWRTNRARVMAKNDHLQTQGQVSQPSQLHSPGNKFF